MADDSAEFYIYEAWQNALQADAVLTALVPAANIIIGPRDDTEGPEPSICITQVGGAYESEDIQGTEVTGALIDAPVFQLEVAIDGKMPRAIEITEAIRALFIRGNAILSAAGICGVKKVGFLEYYDARGLLCRAPRYSFMYSYKVEE